jgi:hypothetical protein
MIWVLNIDKCNSTYLNLTDRNSKTDSMKKRRRINLSWFSALAISLAAINFSACERSPLAVDETAPITVLEQSGKNSNFSYPQSCSVTIEYNGKKRCYQGCEMTLLNGSTFQVPNGALVPPTGTPAQAPVKLTMMCEKRASENELLLTFGPCNSQFDPPAKLTLNWKDLNIDVPRLYFVDSDGKYTEQPPDDIDIQGKRLVIYVHHFSRYALAWGR